MTETPVAVETERFARLKILIGLIRPHRRTVGLGLLLGLVATAMGLATPMVTKWVLDTLSVQASLWPPVLALLGLLVIGTVVSLWQWILLGTLAERIVLDARESLIRKIFRATVSQATRQSGGELVTRVTSDTVLLREAASSALVNLINGVIALVGTLILMAVLDLVLLGATMVAVIAIAICVATLMPRIAKEQELTQDAVGRIGGSLEGAVRAIRTVKASWAEIRQGERIVVEARAAAQHGVNAVRATAYAWSTTWAGVQLAIIVVLGIGAYRVGIGALEVSALIAFLLYAFQLMGPITELTQNVTALQSGIAAAGRIRHIEAFDQEEDLPRTGAAVAEKSGAVLELRGVRAAYGPDQPEVVHGVDLAVPALGHTAIVGPSGAGKTTLLSLVLRFLEPTAGELRLNGRAYSSYTHSEIRSHLAYVEQETPVVPGTIGDNLRFTHPDATDEEIAQVLRAVRLDDKIAELPDGLDTSLTTSAVSGGQRQRIALARAVLRTPAVLLLDEATAQVDGLTEAAVHDVIRQQAERGAVITIAHRLSTVVDADRILVMEAGRVRASGTHTELLDTDELYRDLVSALGSRRRRNRAGSRCRPAERLSGLSRADPPDPARPPWCRVHRPGGRRRGTAAGPPVPSGSPRRSPG